MSSYTKVQPYGIVAVFKTCHASLYVLTLSMKFSLCKTSWLFEFYHFFVCIHSFKYYYFKYINIYHLFNYSLSASKCFTFLEKPISLYKNVPYNLDE